MHFFLTLTPNPASAVLFGHLSYLIYLISYSYCDLLLSEVVGILVYSLFTSGVTELSIVHPCTCRYRIGRLLLVASLAPDRCTCQYSHTHSTVVLVTGRASSSNVYKIPTCFYTRTAFIIHSCTYRIIWL